MPWNTSLDHSPSSSRALRHERLMLLLEKKIYFGEIKANVTFGEKKNQTRANKKLVDFYFIFLMNDNKREVELLNDKTRLFFLLLCFLPISFFRALCFLAFQLR
jgi:tryptophanyl-tRNA synthetase